MYYECHITMSCPPPLGKVLNAWSYSEITGDIVLGKQNWCYFTRHIHASTPVHSVIEVLNEACDYLIKTGATVIRRKVELVLHDEKSAPKSSSIHNTESNNQ